MLTSGSNRNNVGQGVEGVHPLDTGTAPGAVRSARLSPQAARPHASEQKTTHQTAHPARLPRSTAPAND